MEDVAPDEASLSLVARKDLADITLFVFPTQHLITSTFLRFQEYYEGPEFCGRFFSLDEYKKWYVGQKGNFTYYEDFNGFNFPSRILAPFRDGKFDPLSKKEQWVLDQFAGREELFYVIGVHRQDEISSLDHEIAHALFFLDRNYQAEVLAEQKKIDTSSLVEYLKSKDGYHPLVWPDEIQAFIGQDMEYLARKGVDTTGFHKAHLAMRASFERACTRREIPMGESLTRLLVPEPEHF